MAPPAPPGTTGLDSTWKYVMRLSKPGGRAGGRSSPQILVHRLTLSQPGVGGNYTHNIVYYSPSHIFRSSYGPVTEAGFSSESFLHGR